MLLSKKKKKERHKRYIKYRNQLRKYPTYAEQYIQYLLAGVEYTFQKVIKTSYSFYILDFYVPKLKLCIELDGDCHIGREEYDLRRDRFLKSKGIKVLRVKNEDVLNMTGKQFLNHLHTFLDRKG